jgi:hypothetical protein
MRSCPFIDNVRIVIIIINDNEEETPEISIFLLFSIRIDDKYGGGDLPQLCRE